MALFIKLQRKVGFDTFVNGKALSRAADVLDGLASHLNVKPLMEFYSTDPNELPEELEGMEIEITWQEEWFTASEGLATVRAMISHLEANAVTGIDETGTNKERVIADLQEFEQVLSEADKQAVQWHLEIDD